MSVKVLNKTARTKGAVGPNAIVPRIVANSYPIGTVLDYGAGPKAIHATKLRDLGFTVVAYDIGKNYDPKIHDCDALLHSHYDVVMASNVINVQSKVANLMAVLLELSGACSFGGMLIFNYPLSPRKLNSKVVERTIHKILTEHFARWFKVGQIYYAFNPYMLDEEF